MREAIEQLRADRDQQAEQDKREWEDYKNKHEHLREKARRELGIAAPKTREQDNPEPEIETDTYGNEIIDMSGPVEPEPQHDEPPPFEPDSFVPDHEPPALNMDFEMGD